MVSKSALAFLNSSVIWRTTSFCFLKSSVNVDLVLEVFSLSSSSYCSSFFFSTSNSFLMFSNSLFFELSSSLSFFSVLSNLSFLSSSSSFTVFKFSVSSNFAYFNFLISFYNSPTFFSVLFKVSL